MSDSDLSRSPVIGLTTYREQARTLVWDTDFALLHQAYVLTMTAAGGVPVLLPPQPGAAASAVVERLDGIVLTGGADVGPDRYGADRQDGATYRPDRDEWEAALLAAALARDVPVLGVCRGLQVMNVALGGTLEQHVPERVRHDGHQPRPGVFGTTAVGVEADSLLGSLVGARVSVPCHHHQALDRVASGLRVVARAEDATVEAAEDPDRAFVLGVQWHPEQDGTDLRLFAGLVRAAQRRAENVCST